MVTRFKKIGDADTVFGVLADLNELRALDTSVAGFSNFSRAYVEGFGEYVFKKSSSLIDDSLVIIAPTVGQGRWIRVSNASVNNALKKLLEAGAGGGAVDALMLNNDADTVIRHNGKDRMSTFQFDNGYFAIADWGIDMNHAAISSDASKDTWSRVLSTIYPYSTETAAGFTAVFDQDIKGASPTYTRAVSEMRLMANTKGAGAIFKFGFKSGTGNGYGSSSQFWTLDQEGYHKGDTTANYGTPKKILTVVKSEGATIDTSYALGNITPNDATANLIHVPNFRVHQAEVTMEMLPVFADNAAAASLKTGQLYRTSTGEVRIKF